MKNRFTFLLIIAGGVLGAYGFLKAIPLIITSSLGAFIFAVSLIAYTASYGGVIWGIKIKLSSKAPMIIFMSAIGLIIGGFSIVRLLIGAISCISAGRIIELVINIAAFLVLFLIGGKLGKVFLEKMVGNEKNGMMFESIPLFLEIDANIGRAMYFVVSFEGVALFSSTNYCFALYRYTDYQLGDLTTVNEVALVGRYFCQKYSDRFTFKIDSEIIPGEPGQTAVAVGSGGIAIAHSSGTPPQYEFKSYIFTRK